MKKSDTNPYPQPVRQDPAAIFVLVFERFWSLFVQFLPLLIIFFLAGTAQGELVFLVFALASAVISAFLSVLHYFRFHFHIKSDSLVITRGLLNRTHSSVPFERIQVVNFEASVIHRMLNVVKVVVETAGSGSSESEISALKKSDAIALRDYLLAMRDSAVEESGEDTELETEESTTGYIGEKIFSLSLLDLIKLGVTNNHLRTAWAIVAIAFYWWSQYWVYLDDPGDIPYFPILEDLFDSLVASFIIMAIFGLLAASAVLSTGIVIIRYFGLRVLKVRGGLKVSAGLFAQREYSARNNKLQIFYWSTNPLRRLLGLFSVTMAQASSEDGLGNQSIGIPGCSIDQVGMLRNQFFRAGTLEPNIAYKPDRRMIGRYFIFFGLIPVALALLVIYFFTSQWIFWVFLVLPFILLAIVVYYRKLELRINHEVLYLKKGIIEDTWKLIYLHKVQSVELTQTPYMQQRDLVNFRIYTAAGSILLPYITLDQAYTLRDFILYKVESSRRGWI